MAKYFSYIQFKQKIKVMKKFEKWFNDKFSWFFINGNKIHNPNP